MLELIAKLEGYLGQKIPLHHMGSYDRFNDIPDEIIHNARKLPRGHAKVYIQFYTTSRNWDYILYFLEDIVNGTEDLENWYTSAYLAASPSITDLLTNKSIFFYIDVYEKIQFIGKPSWLAFEQNASCLGSPLVFIDNIDITYTPPKGLYTLAGNKEVQKIANEKSLDIIFRRWIATRIARMFYKKPEFLTFKDPKKLHEFAPVNTWTKDALIAFHGLVREREEIGWAEDQVPGFIGPDEFYT